MASSRRRAGWLGAMAAMEWARMMSSCLRSIPGSNTCRQATQADQVASLAEDGARASGWPLSVPWLRLSRQVAELRTLIEGFGDLVSVLDKANPKERAKVYADLG